MAYEYLDSPTFLGEPISKRTYRRLVKAFIVIDVLAVIGVGLVYLRPTFSITPKPTDTKASVSANRTAAVPTVDGLDASDPSTIPQFDDVQPLTAAQIDAANKQFKQSKTKISDATRKAILKQFQASQ